MISIFGKKRQLPFRNKTKLKEFQFLNQILIMVHIIFAVSRSDMRVLKAITALSLIIQLLDTRYLFAFHLYIDSSIRQPNEQNGVKVQDLFIQYKTQCIIFPPNSFYFSSLIFCAK